MTILTILFGLFWLIKGVSIFGDVDRNKQYRRY